MLFVVGGGQLWEGLGRGWGTKGRHQPLLHPSPAWRRARNPALPPGPVPCFFRGCQLPVRTYHPARPGRAGLHSRSHLISSHLYLPQWPGLSWIRPGLVSDLFYEYDRVICHGACILTCKSTAPSFIDLPMPRHISIVGCICICSQNIWPVLHNSARSLAPTRLSIQNYDLCQSPLLPPTHPPTTALPSSHEFKIVSSAIMNIRPLLFLTCVLSCITMAWTYSTVGISQNLCLFKAGDLVLCTTSALLSDLTLAPEQWHSSGPLYFAMLQDQCRIL